MGGVQGDPKKMNFRHFLWNTRYFRTMRVFFRAILSAILIKLGLSFQKIVLEWFYDNWLRSYNGSKLQEDKILKNRNFSVFWNTKISEISESENFGTQGLHLMYLRPPGGGNSKFFRESRPKEGGRFSYDLDFF